jgi:site-specific DNA-cytosine methylase
MGSVRTVEGLRYSVYVVLLNPEVLNIPQIRRRNPKRDPLKSGA